MLSARLFDLPIAVFDVETTGASVDYGDRIVEIGIVRIERGEVVGAFEQLVNPSRRISGGASAITGITNEMLVSQPAFCDVWSHAKKLFEDAIVVGHNVGFDIAFLMGECRRLGCKLCDVVGDLHVLDTVRIARKQLGRGGNGLQRLASRLDIVSAGAHRAPFFGKLGMTGVNFGPTLSVAEIRQHCPRAEIDGQLAPFTFSRDQREQIVHEFLRDFAQARPCRGLRFATAGSINNGSRLAGMRLIMSAIQHFGRYDA